MDAMDAIDAVDAMDAIDAVDAVDTIDAVDVERSDIPTHVWAVDAGAQRRPRTGDSRVGAVDAASFLSLGQEGASAFKAMRFIRTKTVSGLLNALPKFAVLSGKCSFMKYYKGLLPCILCLLLFNACKKDDNTTVYRISQGTFFCECFGECLTLVTAAEGTFDLSTYQTCQATSTIQRDCGEFLPAQEFQALAGLVDWEAFQKLEETIGCPDCADGGGQWIEISRGGEVHRVTYEYGTPPTELAELAEELSQRVVEVFNAGC